MPSKFMIPSNATAFMCAWLPGNSSTSTSPKLWIFLMRAWAEPGFCPMNLPTPPHRRAGIISPSMPPLYYAIKPHHETNPYLHSPDSFVRLCQQETSRGEDAAHRIGQHLDHR